MRKKSVPKYVFTYINEESERERESEREEETT